MDLATWESGVKAPRFVREKASKFGLMVVYMRATGKIIRPTISVACFTKMVTSTRASGKRTRLTALATTFTRMALCIVASGKMIRKMERESKGGLMDQSSKATTFKA